MTFVASPKSFAVGLFAGLASALLVLSPVGGSTLAVPLTMLVELPLVIAALGWGTSVAVLSVLVATGTLLAISPTLALYFAVFLAPPAVIACHLIGLSRVVDGPADAAQTSATGPIVEWYPFGRALVVLALLVVAGGVVVSLVEGFDPSAFTAEETRTFARAYAEAMVEVDPTADVNQLTDLLQPTLALVLRILPFAFTATWTLIGALNLGLGLWITAKSGNLIRPREDLAAFELPRSVTPVLIAAGLASLAGGPFGAIAAAIAGAAAALLLIAGLAVLHTITRPLSFRLPLLVLTYLFLGLWSLPLLVVGILEPYLVLRKRRPSPGEVRPPPQP